MWAVLILISAKDSIFTRWAHLHDNSVDHLFWTIELAVGYNMAVSQMVLHTGHIDQILHDH